MMKSILWRAVLLGGLVLAFGATGQAQEEVSITMKIGKTCGAKYNELFVQVQDGPRARVKPDLTVALTVKPGTKVRVKQSDDSVSMKVEGIWTEAENGGELVTRCLR
ncbi:MAG: hypothetical protein U1F33_14420 [Alphaproteobacteria bacterium]